MKRLRTLSHRCLLGRECAVTCTLGGTPASPWTSSRAPPSSSRTARSTTRRPGWRTSRRLTRLSTSRSTLCPLGEPIRKEQNGRGIVGISVKNSTNRKLTGKNSKEATIRNLPQNSMKYHQKVYLTVP